MQIKSEMKRKFTSFLILNAHNDQKWYKIWSRQLPSYNEAIRDARLHSESHRARKIEVFFWILSDKYTIFIVETRRAGLIPPI